MVVRPGVLGHLRRVQRGFWAHIAVGASVDEASAAAGVSRQHGWAWFADAGGVRPLSLVEGSGRFLSFAEREEIMVGLAAGLSQAEIGRRLGRDPGTISREIRRNVRVRDGQYRATVAQRKAERQAARPQPTKLALNPRLAEEVHARLGRRHSPEQIAGALRLDYPDDESMWISHETIYRSIFVQTRGELRKELAKYLRTGRHLRKPRGRGGEQGHGRIPGMVMISERPAEVEDRAVPGHWEGDLIVGALNQSAIGTLVERSTRFLLLLHLPIDHRADTVGDAVVAAMSELPVHLRRSLTWDQGPEMHRHAEISIGADMPVYFCEPHSPWQRPTNENTNGLLRQYFPKGDDLSKYPKSYLDFVAAEVNARPRKVLGFKTPAQALQELLSPTQDDGVATTG